jgi:hypothetical protein
VRIACLFLLLLLAARDDSAGSHAKVRPTRQDRVARSMLGRHFYIKTELIIGMFRGNVSLQCAISVVLWCRTLHALTSNASDSKVML